VLSNAGRANSVRGTEQPNEMLGSQLFGPGGNTTPEYLDRWAANAGLLRRRHGGKAMPFPCAVHRSQSFSSPCAPSAGARRVDLARRNKSTSAVVTKVLYVEDNDDNVFMLKMRLELLGDFEVLTAEDGEKGCAMAASEHPDIILMDLEMPVMDGWEATRRLKGDPQTRDIPIIALSAHALAGEREKALAAGCDEFDTKPIEFDRLVATVRRILANRK
jgi:CheY-like chemotaxis protein